MAKRKRIRTGSGYFTLEMCRELVSWALDTLVNDEEQRELAVQESSICGRRYGLHIHTSNVMNLVRYWLVKNTDTTTVVVAEATAVNHSTVTRNVQRFEHYVENDRSLEKMLAQIDEAARLFEPKFYTRD